MMADDFHGNRTDIINNTKADYRYIINKYIKPLPHIKNKLEQIKNEYFPKKDKNTLIGIHYRGTDKIVNIMP